MGVQIAVIEVPCSISAPKLFKLFSDFNNIAPKAEPQTYKSVTTIEGVNHVTYSDDCQFNNAKIRLDSMDSDKLTMSYTVIEGDILLGKLDSSFLNVEFIPSANGGSVYRQSMIFTCKGDSRLSDEELDGAEEWYTNTLMAFEAYAIAHPEVC